MSWFLHAALPYHGKQFVIAFESAVLSVKFPLVSGLGGNIQKGRNMVRGSIAAAPSQVR
jgi:hypothetical protein